MNFTFILFSSPFRGPYPERLSVRRKVVDDLSRYVMEPSQGPGPLEGEQQLWIVLREHDSCCFPKRGGGFGFTRESPATKVLRPVEGKATLTPNPKSLWVYLLSDR
jgi:hypothetical protein